jgi:hypothetical protein
MNATPRLLKQFREFGVFERSDGQSTITRIPTTRKFIRDFQPTSLAVYSNAKTALATFDHWVEERKNLKKSKKFLDTSEQMTFNL